jgi:hypothetical protein
MVHKKFASQHLLEKLRFGFLSLATEMKRFSTNSFESKLTILFIYSELIHLVLSPRFHLKYQRIDQ